jgi:GTP pyrophosphokinase
VADEAPRREEYIHGLIDSVKSDLDKAKIKAKVVGRPKHYYSIYQKMVVRGREFADIYDLIGLRIMVDTPKDCYAALGVMHERWSPLPGRFKDYIAMPKFNFYQSLHTSVLGPGGKPVEFQIRTHEMHRRAEYGVAAHWKYKDGAGRKNDTTNLDWVKSLTQWGKETEDPSEFLDSLRFEINQSEVYVFTPKGDIHSLVQGATPVDFAYTVHTEVGHKCIGARVNNRLVPLQSVLSNGDVVEILTSKSPTAGPSRDWLHFVKSPRARAKIRQYFTRERREESIEAGKELLSKQFKRSGISAHRALSHELLAETVDYFRLPDVNALYAAIGEGSVGAQAVVQRIIAIMGGPEDAAEDWMEDESIFTNHQRPASRGRNETGVMVEGDPGMYVKLAKCCTPVFGDDILGFVTRGDGVSVHRRDCTNAANLLSTPERIVSVSWGEPSVASSYLVAVQVDGLDRTGLLSDVTRVFSDQHLNIVSATMNASKDRMFRVRLTFETPDPTHLEHVLNSLQRVSGVYDVYRIKQ